MWEKTGLIYKITCLCNNKIYIGQTIEFKIRKRTHFSDAFNKNRKTYNSKLSRAIRKYGKENFIFEIICEDIPIQYVSKYEIFYINFYCSFKYGYNSNAGGQKQYYGVIPTKRNEETRKKISNAKKGKPGRKWTDEQRNKHSEIFKGKKKSKEHIEKIATSQRNKIKKPHSEKTKEKISKSIIGIKRDEKTIEKYKKANRLRGPNKGKYKGVSFNKSINKWVAFITHNKKQIYIGSFKKIEEAALAYNKKAKFLYGNDCYLNKIGDK